MGMPKSGNRQIKDKYMMCMIIRNRKNEEKGLVNQVKCALVVCPS